MKNNCFYIKIAALMLVVLIYSCKKDKNSPSNPTNGKSFAEFNSSLNYGTFTDVDGNEYKTIKIGDQTWMAENLRTFKYNDGTLIPCVTNSGEWPDLTTGAYCTYNNTTKNDSLATYGCFYNWYAVNTGKLAPKGWHVPSNEEWLALKSYLNENGYNYDNSVSGYKEAKALASNYGWDASINTGTPGSSDYPVYQNKSGFTAMPGGFCVAGNGKYYKIGEISMFWTNSGLNSTSAYCQALENNKVSLISGNTSMKTGYSVRCIKD